MVNIQPDFETIQAQIQERYQAGDYEDALSLAQRYAPRFQDQAPLFTYWQICFQARLGNTRRSITLLQEALQDGIWYGEVLLRKSPSLQPLQGLPEYEDLVALNRKVQSMDEAQQYPLILLRSEGRCSQGSAACPLLIGLHSNAGTVQTALPFWRPAANAGWLVAAPQSSQAVWKGAHVWDDLDASRGQIQHHYQTILNSYAVDPRRTVLAGHSMGGDVAVWLALTGSLPAAGFLAFAPGGPFMDNSSQWQPVVSEAVARLALVDAPFRGYIVYGDQDRSINPEGIHTLASVLEAEGLLCQVEILPGAGHDFDPKFESTLLRALAFLSPETVE